MEIQSSKTDFYQNALDHLFDELLWLNLLINAQVVKLRRAGFFQKIEDFQGVCISDEEVDDILAQGVFGEETKGPL